MGGWLILLVFNPVSRLVEIIILKFGKDALRSKRERDIFGIIGNMKVFSMIKRMPHFFLLIGMGFLFYLYYVVQQNLF